MREVNPPLVSVVMPVYNSERFLAAAIDSILAQTYPRFEFVIVDDGSTDQTPALLASYSQRDARIRVLRHPQNFGLVAALNTGIEHAQGEYIARMDADDMSLPERLARQVAYLNDHSAIGVLGSAIEYIDENGDTLGYERYPDLPGYIRWSLFFYTCFAHPTVMMRKRVIAAIGCYHPEVAEDFDLWIRASSVTKLANLPAVLLRYRRSSSSITAQRQQLLVNNSIELNRRAAIELLGHEVSADLAANLWLLLDRARILSAQDLQQTGNLVAELYDAYLAHNTLISADARAVTASAANKLFYLAAHAMRKSPLTSLRLLWAGVRINPFALLSAASRLLGNPNAYLRPIPKV